MGCRWSGPRAIWNVRTAGCIDDDSRMSSAADAAPDWAFARFRLRRSTTITDTVTTAICARKITASGRCGRSMRGI
jgi:hypothetical protein